MYDILIVGSGPAGLTAAIYALRADKSVLVLEKETFGGQITLSPHVENCPGFPHISGSELGEKLLDQAMGLGAEIDMGEVTGIRRQGETCIVSTAEGSEYAARAVILATGSRHRPLGVAREEEFIGHGISYCAVCDGAFYAGREIAVIGGGNSALQEAVMLSDICKKVTVVQNLAVLTGEKRLADKLDAKDNVDFIYSTVVTALEGEKELTALHLKNTETGKESRLSLDGAFVCIGQIPENEPFREHVTLNDYGYFEAGEDCLTRDPAIFVAGDCRSKRIRQITTATADGAVAAIAACRYLDK
ncbi:MAG: FAD-binding protein [Ruminococcaceae bacterium]|nr:FAD-binding protein [Oscillospiraceae bacterium]